MRILRCCIFFGAALLSAQLISAQTKNPPHIHQEAQKELDNLNYFVGSWILRANIKQSLASEAGEYQQAQKIEWMEGEHFLVSHSETKGVLGNTFGLAVTGFDPDQKRFVYYSFQSTGGVERGTGSLDGKTWTWLSEAPKSEVRLQRRITVVEVSPDEYSLQLEIATDGNNWVTVMMAEAKRQH